MCAYVCVKILIQNDAGTAVFTAASFAAAARRKPPRRPSTGDAAHTRTLARKGTLPSNQARPLPLVTASAGLDGVMPSGVSQSKANTA